MTNVVKFQPFPSTKPLFNGFLDEFFNRSLSDFVGNDATLTQPAVNVVETDDTI